MDLIDVINQRFSVRKYKNKHVEQKKLIQIADAGRLAPSAVNFQPWCFIIVQQKNYLEKIHLVYPREWIKTAPAIIIACVDRSKSWKRSNDGKDFGDVDLAIAVDHMTLRATELGLGTCWVCNFDSLLCTELFDLPSNVEPMVLLPVGYPDIEAPLKKRRALEDIIHLEKYWST